METTHLIPSISAPAQRQRGVVLLIALIVLIAMTLAGLALWRSVDATNVIAGNLAFKESTLMSADRGLQAALVWLDGNRNALGDNNLAQATPPIRLPPTRTGMAPVSGAMPWM